MKKPVRDILDYIWLTLIVSLAVISTLYFNGSKHYQQSIIIGLSVLYIIWGAIHHLKGKTLRARVILEYVLFALLGCSLVIGLLK